MRRWALVVIVGFYHPLLGAPCQGEQLKLADQFLAHLLWDKFWRSDPLPPGQRIRLSLFSGKETAGYCSADLDKCLEFERLPGGGLGDVARQRQRIRQRVSPRQQVDEFLSQPRFLPPVVIGPPTERESVFIAGSKEIRIKVAPAKPDAPQSSPKPTYDFCDATVAVPEDPTPRSIARKVRARAADSLEEVVRSQVRERAKHIGQEVEAVIPFFGDDDPFVNVLWREHGSDNSVFLFVRRNAEWTVVHYATGTWVPQAFQDLCTLVRKNQMISIRP